ncbi:MAG: LPS-assembly protein LptD [Spirochaetaceae bacterium]|jgi:lipopolysaccharide assembly outer membrane protein LptD (OstA)|nr:LPS-assembly protein LptD [Spirochaetaceae bacterium]
MRKLFFIFLLFLTPVFYKPAPLLAQEAPPQEASAGEQDASSGGGEPPLEEGAVSEEAGGAEAAEAEKEIELSEEEKAALKEKEEASRILDMDLRTSTLLELAALCRELGLSEGGGRNELLSRLRDYYKISSGLSAGGSKTDDGRKVITIEKAVTTDYFTLESVDEEYARLSGGVAISLKDGDAIHKISAWEILYNRTRNIVTANGNVKYVREENDSIETFEGDSITVNLDTWVGGFIDTISERSLAGGDTAYRFAGSIISKTEAETTVLQNARITNAAQEENFWSLDASKLWLLPGSDWALFNGVLKVGETPVLWLPFFLFPADEAAFHPVVGNRSREGNYFQTTFYFWGRAAQDASKESSISKILGSGADMEKKPNGVFLRSTRKKRRQTDGKVLAFMLDGYANLGFYTGMRLELPSFKVLNNFKFDGGLGWTRTVYETNGYYTPYKTIYTEDAFNDEIEVNKSNLFGIDVPFRYRMKTNFDFSTPAGSMSFELPLYSDPFIDQDVLNRQEMMDWMEMLKSGKMLTEEEKKSYSLGSYQWTFNYSPNLSTNIFAPYISNLSINSFQSYLNFNYKSSSSSDIPAESPSRIFYYPEKLTMYSLSGSISGSPVTISSRGAVKEKDKERPDALEGVGTPISPWEKIESGGAENGGAKEAVNLSPPVLTHNFTLPSRGALTASWSYRFNPSSAGEMQFNPSKWNNAQDIEWKDRASMFYNFRTDGSTSLSISESNNGLFSLSGSLSGNLAWQDHTYINTESELYDAEDEQKNIRLSDYNATYWTSSFSASAQIKPLYWSDIFKSSSLQYNLAGLFAKSNMEYNENAKNAEELKPVWDVTWLQWRREDLSSHNVSASLSASIMDKTQSLSFSASLPPLYQNYSASAALRAWISETSASASVRENAENQPPTSASFGNIIPGWTFSPLNVSQSFTFGSGKSLRGSLSYDPEIDEFTSLNSSFAFNNFSLSFASARMYKYDYDISKGWIQDLKSEQKLQPRDISASYSKSLQNKTFFNEALNFSVNGRTSLSVDLQRYSYSRFAFSLSFSLGIKNFLDLTLSANTENANIYRYMQDLPFFSSLRDKIEVPGEKNIFIDLINSFRFDDEDLRRASGFKLKSFSLSATHYLGDWNASLSISTSPYLKQGEKVYKFLTNVSFLIQWLPITEIKSEIYYDGQEDKFIKRE